MSQFSQALLKNLPSSGRVAPLLSPGYSARLYNSSTTAQDWQQPTTHRRLGQATRKRSVDSTSGGWSGLFSRPRSPWSSGLVSSTYDERERRRNSLAPHFIGSGPPQARWRATHPLRWPRNVFWDLAAWPRPVCGQAAGLLAAWPLSADDRCRRCRIKTHHATFLKIDVQPEDFGVWPKGSRASSPCRPSQVIWPVRPAHRPHRSGVDATSAGPVPDRAHVLAGGRVVEAKSASAASSLPPRWRGKRLVPQHRRSRAQAAPESV